jgi:hypothetical protein
MVGVLGLAWLAAPRSVTLNGRARIESGAGDTGEGYRYDSARRIVTVRVREAGPQQEIRNRLEAHGRPRPSPIILTRSGVSPYLNPEADSRR